MLTDQGTWSIADPVSGEQLWTRKQRAFKSVRTDGTELAVGEDDLDALRPLRVEEGGCATCRLWLPNTFRHCPDCGLALPIDGYSYEPFRASDGSPPMLSSLSLLKVDSPIAVRRELPAGQDFLILLVGNPARLCAWETETGALYLWSSSRPNAKAWTKICDTPPMAHRGVFKPNFSGCSVGKSVVLATQSGPIAVSLPLTGSNVLVTKAPAINCVGTPIRIDDSVFVPILTSTGLGIAAWREVDRAWQVLATDGLPSGIKALPFSCSTGAGDIVWPTQDGFVGLTRQSRGKKLDELSRWLPFAAETKAIGHLAPSIIEGSAWQPAIQEQAGQRSRVYLRLNPRTGDTPEIQTTNAHALSAGEFHFRKSERFGRPWDFQSAAGLGSGNQTVVPLAQAKNAAVAHVSTAGSAYSSYLNNVREEVNGELWIVTLGSLRLRLLSGVRIKGPYDCQIFPFAGSVWIYNGCMNEMWGWSCRKD